VKSPPTRTLIAGMMLAISFLFSAMIAMLFIMDAAQKNAWSLQAFQLKNSEF
jgi:hypothetical protein